MGDRRRLLALPNNTACDVVKRQYDYLVGHVSAMRIFPYLVSSGLVDQDFRQYLEGERTDRDKMMALLQELTRSPTETWFDRFTNALSKVSQYEVIAGELLEDFTALMAERRAHPPPDNVPMKRRARLLSSSSEPLLVIKVDNNMSGMDGVMKKAIDNAAQAGQMATLLELQKASGRLLEAAEKGKSLAETEKSALEEKEKKAFKELTVANEKLREAEMHHELLVKESKEKAEEMQQKMETEILQLKEDLARVCLEKETAAERTLEVEGERSALERKVASLQAEAEKTRIERENEMAMLEQQLHDARKQQQLGEELQFSHKEEMGNLQRQLERSVTKTVTLEGELAEAKRINEILEQEMKELKEDLEVAMAEKESAKEGQQQAVTEVDEVTAELAKTQAELTRTHSAHSDLQDRYRHEESEFEHYKRMHANCYITNPPNPASLKQPSLIGRGRNQLDVSCHDLPCNWYEFQFFSH